MANIIIYKSVATEREKILKDARELLEENGIRKVEEELKALESLPRHYQTAPAEMVYDGGILLLFRALPKRNLYEIFPEGDRTPVHRT